MKITIERILIILLALVILSLATCRSKEYQGQKATIDSITLANQELKQIINDQGRVIQTQQSIVTTSSNQISNLTDSIFHLTKKQDKKIKEVIAYYKGITNTGVDSFLIPYTDSNYLHKFEDSLTQKCVEVINYYLENGIILPRRVEQYNPWFRFAGTLKKEGLLIDSLSFPDTLQLRFVEKKGNLFKRKSVEIQYFHTNPYVKDIQANSVIYKPRPKTRWLEKAILVGAGIFLGSKL